MKATTKLLTILSAICILLSPVILQGLDDRGWMDEHPAEYLPQAGGGWIFKCPYDGGSETCYLAADIGIASPQEMTGYFDCDDDYYYYYGEEQADESVINSDEGTIIMKVDKSVIDSHFE